VKRLSKQLLTGLVLSAVAVLGVTADLKIGVVNYERLMAESPQAKVASEALQREFGTKQKEITNLQASLKAKEERLAKDGATMTAEQKSRAEKDLRDGSRDYQARATEFQDDVTARQNEETSRLQAELVSAVQNYAAIQKFDLVLASGVIFASTQMDITSAVLAILPTTGSARAAAPAAKAPAAAPAGK
jgi:outer membrane protein